MPQYITADTDRLLLEREASLFLLQGIIKDIQEVLRR